MMSEFETIMRPSVPALDARLNSPTKVLDHGFIRVIDYMGDDSAICQAARVSYGQGTKSISDDRGLIRYLMRHWHTTPFEMCEIKLHVKLPVFVARQWIRHRTANVNEYSARYSILDREFYIPEKNQICVQSLDNKQGRGQEMDDQGGQEALKIFSEASDEAYDLYEYLLGDEKEPGLGVTRELSRMVLPTNIYTQWYWKTDLHNLFHFLRLRADSHAQWEIRQYANVICELVKDWVPLAYGAFEDYRLNAEQFSAQELDLLKAILRREAILDEEDAEFFNLSSREAKEFISKLT